DSPFPRSSADDLLDAPGARGDVRRPRAGERFGAAPRVRPFSPRRRRARRPLSRLRFRRLPEDLRGIEREEGSHVDSTPQRDRLDARPRHARPGRLLDSGRGLRRAGKPAIGGASYLIFFFHFPSAFSCLNFFVFAGILAAIDLFRGQRDPRGDMRTLAAVEIGVLACSVTLVTGSIWAKAAWNMFWDFRDMRLMT